jgi:hypothetical protein
VFSATATDTSDMHRFSYENHAGLQLATLPARLVGLAAERLDIGDATALARVQRVLRAEQEVHQALAGLAQTLITAGIAPADVETDLEARAAALRDLQSVVLLAVAAD